MTLMIDCNKPKRPISLRTISLSLTFIYIFTSVDIQLAHSAPSVSPLPVVIPAKVDADKVSDTHFIQDFDWTQDSPLEKTDQDNKQQGIAPEDLPETPEAIQANKESVANTFLQANPLGSKDGKQLNIEEDPKMPEIS